MMPSASDSSNVVRKYVEAWNDHDTAGIVATFAAGGTYVDSSLDEPLTGDAIGDYASEVIRMFPGVQFRIVSMFSSGRTVAVEWRMEDTTPGSPLSLPGCDIITVGSSGIESVRGHFDRYLGYRQLGFQVEVMPGSEEKSKWGIARYAVGAREKAPRAVAITMACVRNQAEREEVEARSTDIADAMVKMPGFISFVGVAADDRLITLTQWESAEAIRQLTEHPLHREAVRRMYQDNLAEKGLVSTWLPVHVMEIVRCPDCEAIVGDSGCPNGHAAAPLGAVGF
jgi:heme-degrading monooxygenase HmoA